MVAALGTHRRHRVVSLGKNVILCLVLVQPRKTGNHPDMTETSLLIWSRHLEETVWFQICWLHRKPADLDLQCFLKRAHNFEKQCKYCAYSDSDLYKSD